ncbi:hypothetical protein [Tessaracoccus coleopterorum]|uniref:hypothetical protein n=1 Tax=Tessaracoccus coleopterorum TaxID=2714950 RepID=UPI0018D3775E|nr:hypothetical protein [Tessaracoccus coleopterorum]
MLRRRRTVAAAATAVGLVLLLVAGIGGYWYLRPLLRTGTGYAAHNLCAVTLVAGRVDAATDLPSNPLVPYLTPWMGPDGQSRVTVVGFLAGQNAWYTPGFGCTVAEERPTLPDPAEVAPAPEFPTAEVDPAIEAALDNAFGRTLTTRPGPRSAPAVSWCCATAS